MDDHIKIPDLQNLLIDANKLTTPVSRADFAELFLKLKSLLENYSPKYFNKDAVIRQVQNCIDKDMLDSGLRIIKKIINKELKPKPSKITELILVMLLFCAISLSVLVHMEIIAAPPSIVHGATIIVALLSAYRFLKLFTK